MGRLLSGYRQRGSGNPVPVQMITAVVGGAWLRIGVGKPLNVALV